MPKNFSIFSTFEDFTAKKFSFEHLDKNDFEKEMIYSGYVQKNKKINPKICYIFIRQQNYISLKFFNFLCI